MSTPPQTLGYFGPAPVPDRSLTRTCLRLLGNGIVFIALALFVVVRAALLLAGVVCIFAGTFLLTLGGKRSAAQTLSRWRARAVELSKLWLADIARPLRRRPAAPLTVLPV